MAREGLRLWKDRGLSILQYMTDQSRRKGQSDPSEISGSASLGVVSLAGLLLFRGVAFLAAQALIALVLSVQGTVNPWFVAGGWWMIAGTLVNLATIWLLLLQLRREGRGVAQVLSARDRTDAPRSSAYLVLYGLLGVALFLAGSIGFARLFMGGFLSARMILLQPLPVWAALVGGIGFPLSLALVELPWYYGYLYPRLRERGLPAVLALLLVVLMHGAQYAALPFLPAVPFVLYRSLSFLPLALGLAVSVGRARAVLPIHMIILAAGHGWAGYELIRLSLGG